VSGLSPSLALAPTGDRVVLSDAGVVVVHQLASGRNVRIDTALEGVTAIELTRDGSRVAMATSAGIAGVWDARTGGKLALRTIQRFPIRDLALTPDGRRMALLATNDYRLLLWDHQEDRMKALPSDGAVKGSLFFADGRTLVYLAGDRSVRLVDVDHGTTRVLRGHRVGMVDAALSPARPIFATGDAGGFVRLWDHRTGSSALVQAHTGAIEALSFSPDGRWLVTAGQDGGGSLRVWDLASLPLTAPPTPATIDYWLGSQTSANVHGDREVRTLAPDAR
jgi:WD40 repeat protein